MEERTRFRPFTGDSVTSFRLKDAPIAVVMCQVKWPLLAGWDEASMQKRAHKFAERIAANFPLESRRTETSIDVTVGGVASREAVLYQWETVSRTEVVILSQQFLTYVSREYRTYDSFVRRYRSLLEALSEIISIPLVDRVGLRYINHLVDFNMVNDLKSMVHPSLLGYQALDVEAPEVFLQQTLNQGLYSVADCALHVRSGLVPGGVEIDAAIPVVESPSWVLDLDAFREGELIFDLGEIESKLGRLADISYDFFKLVVNKGYVEAFGG